MPPITIVHHSVIQMSYRLLRNQLSTMIPNLGNGKGDNSKIQCNKCEICSGALMTRIRLSAKQLCCRQASHPSNGYSYALIR
jgi:hypothetical protein